MAVEYTGLCTVDDRGPEAQLADNLIQRPAGDEPLLINITQSIKCSTQQREQISLELVAGGDVPAVGAGDVVGREQQAHAADADEDAEHLGPVIADLEEGEGEGDDDDDGPEVYELGGEDGRVAVGEDGEVVAFDVEEGEDDVCMPNVSTIFLPQIQSKTGDEKNIHFHPSFTTILPHFLNPYL